MSNVVEFPNNEINFENELINQNKNFINTIRAKMQIEYDALLRTNNESAIQLGKAIHQIVNAVTDVVETVFENTEISSNVAVPYFINQCMQSVNAILAGGVISPITGCDEEWIDTTVPEDIGQEFKCTYRDKEYSVKIESVQVNKRYPKIFRLNNDNNLAHRIDYFQFHDVTNPDHIHLTEDSIRFIKFPYTMQAIHSHCVLEDNADTNQTQISDYLDFEYDEILNGLIYPDQSNNDRDSYVIAPKIPFSALEENGIDVAAEIDEYLTAVNGLNGSNFDYSELTEFDEE